MLGQGADLHMAQLVIPFWCRLTRVVPDRIQEGHKTAVCMCVCGGQGNALEKWHKRVAPDKEGVADQQCLGEGKL